MFEDQDTMATQFDSNVDLINASDVPVTVTTTTVAEVTAKKSKRTNIATILNSLAGLTDEEIEDTKPSVIRGLNAEVARVTTKYQGFLTGSN